MKKNIKQPFPSEGEERLFGRDVLALAARMVAQGRRLSLKNDVAFKLFLASDTKESRACLRHFLSAVIGRTVRRARVKNPDLLPDIVGKKKPRLDINCEFDDGQRADIELQLTKADDDQKLRALYYGSKLFSGTLNEGEFYEAVPAVYQIFLIDFDLFDDGAFFHRAMMRLDDGKLFSDRLQLRFFSLKVPDDVDNSLKDAANWCKFIAGSTDDDVLSELGSNPGWKEELSMAMRAYNKVSAEERAWAYHLSMDRAEVDYRNELKLGMQKARKKGLAEGRAEGLAEGRAKGKAEGLSEGIAIGEREKALSAARNMLARNYPVTDIAEITGLLPEEVESLSASLG